MVQGKGLAYYEEDKVKKGTLLYGILCGVGGVMVGAFANRLNTSWGAGLFAVGVCLSVFSIMKLNKGE